jgi:peptidoglycan hydrolase CwlO-like protein
LRNFKKETDKLRNDSDTLLNELARMHKENRELKHRISILEKQIEIMTLSFGGKANE